MISVIIPTLNEAKHQILNKALLSLFNQSPQVPYEVIISDSHSTDKTLQIANQFPVKIVHAGNCNRAVRMNKGAKQAQYDVLLFHHPRSIISADALYTLTHALQKNPNLVGGGFTHRFDDSKPSPMLKFTSWYSNHVRAKRGIIYLDHCIFTTQKTFNQIGGFPNIDIFEDTVFPHKMRKLGQTAILPCTSVTSSVRFKKRGVKKQILMNQLMKAGFHLGIHPNKLNKMYEGKNPFNVRY